MIVLIIVNGRTPLFCLYFVLNFRYAIDVQHVWPGGKYQQQQQQQQQQQLYLQ